MSIQQPLAEFYSNVAVVNELFNIVNDSNERILGELDDNIKEDEVETENITNGILLYILSFTRNYHDIIIELFEEMEKFEFSSTPSVSSKFVSEETENDYDKLSTINLYDHTTNCAVQVAETLVFGNDTPSSAVGISIIIALLHDFGESPIIANKFSHSEYHNQISANYAKVFLSKFLNHKNIHSRINKTFIELVFTTINNFHDAYAPQTPWLKVLKVGDKLAREKELEYYKICKQASSDDS